MSTRLYPIDCTSAYCGRIDCRPDCRHLPALEAFRAWVEAAGATRPDPVWCPLIWSTPAPGTASAAPAEGEG